MRGTRLRPAVSPEQLTRMVDGLCARIRRAGAAAIVVCQIKPMQTTDVSPFNMCLNDYLRSEQDQGRGGFGCRTQIKLDYLKSDGFHIRPQFDSIIDCTYACAFMGVPVPCPTPWDQFVPEFVRHRWEREWPRSGGAGPRNYGW